MRPNGNPPTPAATNPLHGLIPPNIPPELQATYLNLLAMNTPILTPLLRQFLNNREAIQQQQQPPPAAPQVRPPPIPQLQQPQPPRAIMNLLNRPPSPQPIPRAPDVEVTGEIVYCVIEGEKVMGFLVWGEVRLCLPHLLRFVLHDVDIEHISQAITNLHINCTKCSPPQLATLHNCSALPTEVTACGLIRLSDAERMLKHLRSDRPRLTLNDLRKGIDSVDGTAQQGVSVANCEPKPNPLETFIDVIHDCFGSQKGRLYPLLYTSENSACISCNSCEKLFSPLDFAGHHHAKDQTDHCVHWGFKSNNWRTYLHLDLEALHARKKVKREGSENEDPTVAVYQMFDEFKLKFAKVNIFVQSILCFHAFMLARP